MKKIADVHDIANNMLRDVQKGDTGGTYRQDGTSPTDGFVIGGICPSVVIPKVDITYDTIFKAVVQLMQCNPVAVGFWVNPEKQDAIELDALVYTMDSNFADSECIRLNQLCYYDLKTGKEIWPSKKTSSLSVDDFTYSYEGGIDRESYVHNVNDKKFVIQVNGDKFDWMTWGDINASGTELTLSDAVNALNKYANTISKNAQSFVLTENDFLFMPGKEMYEPNSYVYNNNGVFARIAVESGNAFEGYNTYYINNMEINGAQIVVPASSFYSIEDAVGAVNNLINNAKSASVKNANKAYDAGVKAHETAGGKGAKELNPYEYEEDGYKDWYDGWNSAEKKKDKKDKKAQDSIPKPVGLSYDFVWKYEGIVLGSQKWSCEVNEIEAIVVKFDDYEWSVNNLDGINYDDGAESTLEDAIQEASVQLEYALDANGFTPPTKGASKKAQAILFDVNKLEDGGIDLLGSTDKYSIVIIKPDEFYDDYFYGLSLGVGDDFNGEALDTGFVSSPQEAVEKANDYIRTHASSKNAQAEQVPCSVCGDYNWPQDMVNINGQHICEFCSEDIYVDTTEVKEVPKVRSLEAQANYNSMTLEQLKKEFEDEDYQGRANNGNSIRYGVPDAITVEPAQYNLEPTDPNYRIKIVVEFKSTSQKDAEAWVSRYFFGYFPGSTIESFQTGDYQDDWVTVELTINKAKTAQADYRTYQQTYKPGHLVMFNNLQLGQLVVTASMGGATFYSVHSIDSNNTVTLAVLDKFKIDGANMPSSHWAVENSNKNKMGSYVTAYQTDDGTVVTNHEYLREWDGKTPVFTEYY